MNIDRIIDIKIQAQKALIYLYPYLLSDKCSIEIINKGYKLRMLIKKIERQVG